jgi:hypothetical protein
MAMLGRVMHIHMVQHHQIGQHAGVNTWK